MTGHVFISYSRGDAAQYVGRLVQHLRDQGIPVWYDTDIETGDRWLRMLRDRIDSCAAFVAIMTPAGGESRWIEMELTQADRKGKVVLPLLLDGDVYFALGNRQYEDVGGGLMPSSAYIRKLAELTGASPAPTGATSGEAAAASASLARSPGSADFRAYAAKNGLPDQLSALTRLADWADALAGEGFAIVSSLRGKAPRALLLPLLEVEGVGMATIYCESGKASIALWRSVFERRAPDAIGAVEAAAGMTIGAGKSTNRVTEALLDALTIAYRQAGRTSVAERG